MIDKLKNSCNNWWVLLILGILFLGAGIALFFTPVAAPVVMAYVLAFAMIFGGIFGLFFVFSNRKEIPAWGWSLILPILSLIAGIILLCNPGASMIFVICLFAVIVLFKSIEAICYSISMSKVEGSGWGWTLAAGIIGTCLAFYLFSNMLVTGAVMAFFVAFALIFLGIESIAISIQLSKIKSEAKKMKEKMEA